MTGQVIRDLSWVMFEVGLQLSSALLNYKVLTNIKRIFRYEFRIVGPKQCRILVFQHERARRPRRYDFASGSDRVSEMLRIERCVFNRRNHITAIEERHAAAFLFRTVDIDIIMLEH